MADKFQVGDEVILSSWARHPAFCQDWRPEYEPVVGKTVKLKSRHHIASGYQIWVLDYQLPSGQWMAWLESSFKLARASISLDEEVPPTQRGKKQETPQWLVSRSNTLNEKECPKCGAPSTPSHPCKYHPTAMPTAPSIGDGMAEAWK